MTTSHRWVAGAVAAAVLLVAASWFALIAPQRSEAAQLREQATAQESTNDMIRLRTQQLRAQFASLPQRRAQLAEIRQQMPSSPNLPALVRGLSAVADDAGVSVVRVAPGQPQPVGAGPSAATGASAASGSAAANGSAATSGSAAAGAPSASGSAAVAGGSSTGSAAASSAASLQAVPTTLVAKGSYAELTLFLQKLQGSMRRAFLVENLTLATDTSTRAGTSSPVLTMTLTGKVFVLAPPTTASGAAAGASASAPATTTAN